MIFTETELNNLIKKAIKILRKNYSCPGEDGLSYKSLKNEPTLHFSAIRKRFIEITKGENKFLKPKAVNIVDAHKKERTIYVYNIYDRIIQQCVRLLISSSVKSKMSDKVLSHKTGIDLKKKIKELLYASEDTELVLRLDIQNYYSSINKEILYGMLINIGVSEVLVSITRASFSHCEDGIPTGNCLSPILSDFYLTPIDLLFENGYTRFSDDMFFTIKNLVEVNEIFDKVTPILTNLKLKINESKQQIIRDKNIENIL